MYLCKKYSHVTYYYDWNYKYILNFVNKTLTLFLVFLPLFCFSQKAEKYILVPKIDSFNINYSFQSSKLNLSYQNNKKTFNQIHELLLFVGAKEIDSICIYSNLFPEFENNKKNQKLSKSRTLAIKDFFNKKYPHIPVSKFKIRSGIKNSDYLKDFIFLDDSIPNRKNVAEKIIYNKSKRERKDDLGSDDKKKDICTNHILSNSISTNTIIYYRKRDYNVEYIHKLNYKNDSDFLLNNKIPIDSNQFILENKINSNIEQEYQNLSDTTDLYASTAQELQKPKASILQLALKTNLIYYLALAPNIELELQYKAFSLNFDYLFPWYVNTPKRFCYQLLLGGIEGRYWIRTTKQKSDNNPLIGFFVGAYLQRGIFDFQNSDKGAQGDIEYLYGLSLGYSKSISKYFNLEFGLGFGYFKSRNVNYYLSENFLIRENSSTYRYIGLTKAKISLVWKLRGRREAK